MVKTMDIDEVETLLCKIKQREYSSVSNNLTLTEDFNECPVGEEKPWSLSHIPKEWTEDITSHIQDELYPTWEIALKISFYIIPIIIGIVSKCSDHNIQSCPHLSKNDTLQFMQTHRSTI